MYLLFGAFLNDFMIRVNCLLVILQCKSFDGAVLYLCEHLLEKLNGIFIHSDATVLQAAAEASRYLLQSKVAMYWISNCNTSIIFYLQY